jgi:hypothetical protein
VTRCHIALASAWLALSLTLTMLSFPVLMQGSSVCDGVDDDDSFWEPALVERDGLRVADEALVGTDSHICKPVSGIDYEVRLSEPLRARHHLQIGLRPSYASQGTSGDEDSLEPH